MDTGLRRYDGVFIGVGEAGMMMTTTPSRSRHPFASEGDFAVCFMVKLRTFVIARECNDRGNPV